MKDNAYYWTILFIISICCTCNSGILVHYKQNRQEVKFDTQEDIIKVMSFNIRNGLANDGDNSWNNRRDLVYKTIVDQGADIVGLQEAFLFQISQIEFAIRGYDIVTVGRDDGNKAGEHCSILYRRERFALAESGTFWLSETPDTPGSITWNHYNPRICTWVKLVDKVTNQAVYFYNVHMDHESQEARFYSAVLVARRIANRQIDAPAILVGDFNMTLDNDAMKYLMHDGYNTPVHLVDSWHKLYPDRTNLTSCHLFTGDIKGNKIDHILTTESMETINAEIIYYNEDGRYPSDHYPVTALLKYKDF